MLLENLFCILLVEKNGKLKLKLELKNWPTERPNEPFLIASVVSWINLNTYYDKKIKKKSYLIFMAWIEAIIYGI